MSKNIVLVLMYHRHKLLDLTQISSLKECHKWKRILNSYITTKIFNKMTE
jgi:hypothetical protein